jgi:hypothetical protein
VEKVESPGLNVEGLRKQRRKANLTPFEGAQGKQRCGEDRGLAERLERMGERDD